MGNKTATFLQLLKETGIRPGEAWNLRWIDIDPERAIVNIIPEKNSRPRQLKVSSQLIGMLNGFHDKDGFVFRNPNVDPIRSLDDFSRNFSERRRKLAKKLDNPRILRIGFRTLRHFKATTEYHKTRDILHVMQLLGHKSIRNTLVYTHLVDFGGDEFVCKVAKSVDEAKVLVESGFDYVTDVDNAKMFRKRK
jgi:integrase